ncbi:MAG: protein-glutamate methylesterase/protein-glutamine glutaminase [Candidatus Methanospirareceae archaeon]
MTLREEMRNGNKKIRVLVVDDSAFMRILVSDMLNTDPGIEVVGVARNGEDGVEKAKTLSPDVITMDVEMPKMNGIEAVKHIMAEKPTPVVMLSGITKRNADVTLEALANGAFDFVTKPSGTLSLDIEKVNEELIAKIKGAYAYAGRVGSTGMKRLHVMTQYKTPVYNTPAPPVEEGRISRRIIVIGSSTGGPKSLDEIFSALPPGIPAGMLVVQHMPPYFTNSLAERLDKHSTVHVREGKEGDVITDGSALVAPGDYHMTVNSGKIHLDKGTPVNAIRPSVDVTMQSIAKTYGSNTIGILLTGMGKDGAAGMKAIKEKGGKTIACDENTSVIFGMPKEAIKLGCVDEIVPLYEIADTIMKSLEVN